MINRKKIVAGAVCLTGLGLTLYFMNRHDQILVEAGIAVQVAVEKIMNEWWQGFISLPKDVGICGTELLMRLSQTRQETMASYITQANNYLYSALASIATSAISGFYVAKDYIIRGLKQIKQRVKPEVKTK